MLDLEEVAPLVQRMWSLHQLELEKFNIIHDYMEGRLGRPSIPASADGEVRDIWRLCVLNVLPFVLDAFVQNLSVVGYRDAAAEQDAAGWDLWQRNQMDARQAEIYTDAVKYGVGYVVVTPGRDGPVFRPRSPRQLVCVYEDPQVDRWPQYALEIWIDESDAKPKRKGLLIDDEYTYELDLGFLSVPVRQQDEEVQKVQLTISQDGIGEGVAHEAKWNGEPVCPVVRYINRRNSEDLVEGEIYRLLADQRTINEVNFDRLIVGRFGAFPQKVISNWIGITKDKALEISAKRVLSFEDDVKVQSFPAASLEPYNTLIEKLVEHVGQKAQISLASAAGGKMVNTSAEALYAAEMQQQRKLTTMRESHGESHEQLLAVAAGMDGGSADDAAEVVWRDTEARSFGVMADGILKVSQALAAGLPIEPLLPLLPGLTQQMIGAIKKHAELARQQALQMQQQATVTSLVNALKPAAQSASQDAQVNQLAGQTKPGNELNASQQKGAQNVAGEPGFVTPDLQVRPMRING